MALTLILFRKRSLVMHIMALSRAGHLIWSDTLFAKFFTLIYIAVVLKGSLTKLALRDYVVVYMHVGELDK